MSENTVKIYTDGACINNPGYGGWAAYFVWVGHTEFIHKKLISGHAWEKTTNNKMELKAVIEALKIIKRDVPIEIITDSKYVSNAYTEGWIINWKKNDWYGSSGPVKNQDLWKELDKLVQKYNIKFTWVRGHTGVEGNEIADTESNKQAGIAYKNRNRKKPLK